MSACRQKGCLVIGTALHGCPPLQLCCCCFAVVKNNYLEGERRLAVVSDYTEEITMLRTHSNFHQLRKLPLPIGRFTSMYHSAGSIHVFVYNVYLCSFACFRPSLRSPTAEAGGGSGNA